MEKTTVDKEKNLRLGGITWYNHQFHFPNHGLFFYVWSCIPMIFHLHLIKLTYITLLVKSACNHHFCWWNPIPSHEITISRHGEKSHSIPSDHDVSLLKSNEICFNPLNSPCWNMLKYVEICWNPIMKPPLFPSSVPNVHSSIPWYHHEFRWI